MTQGLANMYTVKTIYRTLDRLTKRSADNMRAHHRRSRNNTQSKPRPSERFSCCRHICLFYSRLLIFVYLPTRTISITNNHETSFWHIQMDNQHCRPLKGHSFHSKPKTLDWNKNMKNYIDWANLDRICHYLP